MAVPDLRHVAPMRALCTDPDIHKLLYDCGEIVVRLWHLAGNAG
jgi:hypothetical protein